MDTTITPRQGSRPTGSTTPHRSVTDSAGAPAPKSETSPLFRYVVVGRSDEVVTTVSAAEAMRAVLRGRLAADDYELQIVAVEDSDV